MKKISPLLIIVFLITSCSSNRYLLTDRGKDKNFLEETIKKISKEGKISKKPVVVIDGVPYRYDIELKSKKLEISKEDISKIESLKHDVGIAIYGKAAKAGVLIVTTKSKLAKKEESIDNKTILYLLDDKAITKSELEKISPDDIESIDVIKGKENTMKYTQENYDGVIIIHLKKKN